MDTKSGILEGPRLLRDMNKIALLIVTELGFISKEGKLRSTIGEEFIPGEN